MKNQQKAIAAVALLLAAGSALSTARAANAADSVAGVPVPISLVPQTPLATDGRPVTLSLQQCIEIALQTNPTIKVADMEIERVEYSKKETKAGLFPKIDFSGAYQRAIELQTINMNMGGQTTSIKMGSDNTWNFGFSAAMPLVNAQLWKSIKLSEYQILQNYEKARSTRLDLINQISKSYYALLLARASYQVVKENYDLAVYNAGMYAKKYEIGTATEYDVLRSSVQVKNVEPELLQAQIAIRSCQLQLKVLMGIGEEIEIVPDVTLEQMRTRMSGYVESIDRSLNDNTNMVTLNLTEQTLAETVKLRKAAYYPTLAASFNLNWSALSNGSPFKNQQFHPYSNVGLALSVPIFSGGSKYYGIKQAEIQHKEIALQRENLENSLNMQIDLAIDNMNKEMAQIESNAEGVRMAVRAHDIMQKSFDIGAASYLNLRDSEVAETTSKLTYYQAIYNYLVSTCDLDLLLGREDALIGAGYVKPTRK